jgi:hypothetical protein
VYRKCEMGIVNSPFPLDTSIQKGAPPLTNIGAI